MKYRNWDSPAYREWRAKVLRRDNYRCQMPKCRCKAKEAHHIRKWADYISLRYDVDNGISLCWGCHKKIWGREFYYIEIFSRIVRSKS